MSAALSGEERLEIEADFRESARRFFAEKMAPLVAEAEARGRFPRQLLRECGEFGLFEISRHEEQALRLPLTCVWIEEGARVCAGLTAPLMVQAGLGTSAIAAHGDEAMRERYLTPALAGEKLSAFALTEADAGSHVLGMKTTARRDGEGWLLAGSKLYITNAPSGDFMIVAAYTDRERKGAGVSLFVVENEDGGVEVQRLDKHGHHSTETGAVFLDDVRLGPERLIGAEGEGYGYLMEALVGGRVAHAARSLGVARAALREGVAYVTERHQFGRALSEFQGVRFALARALAETEAASEYVYALARRHRPGAKLLAEAAIAKLLAAEAAVSAAEAAMHLHGGYGYMTEAPIERLVRDARLYPVTEGTTEIQWEIVSKELLRSPARFGAG